MHHPKVVSEQIVEAMHGAMPCVLSPADVHAKSTKLSNFGQ